MRARTAIAGAVLALATTGALTACGGADNTQACSDYYKAIDSASSDASDTTEFTVAANEATTSQLHDEILSFGQWVSTNGMPYNDAMWADYGKLQDPIKATCPPPPLRVSTP